MKDKVAEVSSMLREYSINPKDEINYWVELLLKNKHSHLFNYQTLNMKWLER